MRHYICTKNSMGQECTDVVPYIIKDRRDIPDTIQVRNATGVTVVIKIYMP